jgi:hypothetical protein
MSNEILSRLQVISIVFWLKEKHKTPSFIPIICRPSRVILSLGHQPKVQCMEAWMKQQTREGREAMGYGGTALGGVASISFLSSLYFPVHKISHNA